MMLIVVGFSSALLIEERLKEWRKIHLCGISKREKESVMELRRVANELFGRMIKSRYHHILLLTYAFDGSLFCTKILPGTLSLFFDSSEKNAWLSTLIETKTNRIISPYSSILPPLRLIPMNWRNELPRSFQTRFTIFGNLLRFARSLQTSSMILLGKKLLDNGYANVQHGLSNFLK